MIMAGTVGMEDMGFQTYGFAFGRADEWEPDLVYWGPEVEMLASDRREKDGKLQRPLGAMHMGLIYVNPEAQWACLILQHLRKTFVCLLVAWR